MDNTIQLYMDEENEIKGYPVTSPDRVIDEDGISVKEKLDNKANKEIISTTIPNSKGVKWLELIGEE